MNSSIPCDYPRIKFVSDFDELVGTPFDVGVNALCWPRRLEGDFQELTQLLHQQSEAEAGVTVVDEGVLSALRPSAAGALARDAIARDLALLSERDLQPELNCVTTYARAEASAIIATDVYSFHVDRAPIEVDTWLCTYVGAATQGLRNDQAVPRTHLKDTRSQLLHAFGGPEGEAFEAFLRQHSYDLHFAPTQGAVPWSFGVGCLWRVAVMWPGCLVPPCIHRAPCDEAGAARLLLIG
jgi:hypothetical protein